MLLGLAAAVPVYSSCGAIVGVGVALDDNYPYGNDYDYGLIIRDGYWRNGYVYWDGSWYYHGIGTPYIWDPTPWWY
jgi:hypothetical protein